LRRKEDVEAVKQALKDGTIDVIATDHAPHHLREKNLSFQLAPNGVIGLETSFAVSYTELVRTGILTPAELIWKMSTGPARILGIDQGQLQIGAPANLVVMDVDKEYEVEPAFFASKGRNSPFIGRKVFGETAYTIAGGRIIYDRRKSK
jgi:dihydroorotase